MKKLTRRIFHVLTATAICIVSVQCNNADVMKLIETEVQTVNVRTPIKINDAVSLDSCKAIAPNILTTYYSQDYLKARQFAKGEFESINKPRLIESLQATNGLKNLRENNVTFVYVYKDSDGKTIGEVTLKSDDYR